jgi:hypothetical protein
MFGGRQAARAEQGVLVADAPLDLLIVDVLIRSGDVLLNRFGDRILDEPPKPIDSWPQGFFNEPLHRLRARLLQD